MRKTPTRAGGKKMEITPELIGYMKAVVKEMGIAQTDMTKEKMKKVMTVAYNRMHKMVDDVLNGHDLPGHRYHVAMRHTAKLTYDAIK
jgi:hypothetical protein